MTKRAVVVGINDYSGLDPSGKSNLSSCVDDANSIYDLLVTAFGFDASESTKYTDQQASSGNLVTALSNLISRSQAGDVACFYYSGHGSRLPANSEQADCDKFYESIVPASGAWISDQTLFGIADALQPSWVNFTVILDSCHSGGMDQETDATMKCRSLVFAPDLVTRLEQYLHSLIPFGICISPDSAVCDGNVSNVTASDGRLAFDEDPDKELVDFAKMTLVAGCRYSELSWETGGHGLLTKAFLDLVNASNFQISYGDLLDELRTRVQNDFNSLILPSIQAGLPRSQTPQLRGQRNRMGEGFLQGWIDSR
jgi:hypothetical protein